MHTCRVAKAMRSPVSRSDRIPSLGLCPSTTRGGCCPLRVLRDSSVCSLRRVWLCGPTDCSPPASSVPGVLQARILEWVAVPSSRGASRPGDGTASLLPPALAGGLFTARATRGAPSEPRGGLLPRNELSRCCTRAGVNISEQAAGPDAAPLGRQAPCQRTR